MKRTTRRVTVKDSSKEITNKHEDKPDIYSDQFLASDHLFFSHFFPLKPA